MKLSIVILNYRQKDFLSKCLAAIFRYSPRYKMEVIVVNAGKDDGSKAFLKEKWAEKIRLIFIPNNLGYGEGNNIGIKYAHGQYVFVLNPDVEVKKGTLFRLVDFMDKNKHVGICGPQLIYPDGTIQDSYRKFPRITDLLIKRVGILRKIFKNRMIKYLMYDADNSKKQKVDWLVGAAIIIRKEIIDKIGNFDKRYFLFFEDTDFCRRVWENGYQAVYLPQAKAAHHHKRLSGGSILHAVWKKTFWIHIISAVKYFWKWKGK